MRQHRSNLIAVVVILLVAGGVFLWTRPQLSDLAADTSGTPAATTASPATPQDADEAPVDTPMTLGVEEIDSRRQALTDTVIQFESAYWSRTYADSADTRVERLRQLATETFLGEIRQDFESVEEQPAPPDLLFVQNQWSTTASVSPDGGISGEFTNSTSACVTALVAITTIDASGRTVSNVPVETRREYVLRGDTWLAARNIPAGSVC